MAKGSNMLGKFRGKMGGMVYRVDPDAGQIVSEYNPHPSNPRTVAQVAQRNKMNLAGQVSQLTPYAAVAGLGGSRRNARSKFISNLLKVATSAAGSEQGELIATIQWDSVVLSKGLPYTVNATITASTTEPKVTVSIPVMDLGTPVVGFVVVAYLTRGNYVTGCYVKSVDATAVGTTVTAEIPLPGDISDYTDADFVNAYVIPVFETNEGVRVAFNSGVNNLGAEANVAAIRQLVAGGAYGESRYAGYATWE